jgi:hypothetical protein
MGKRKSGNCPSCYYFLKDSIAIAYHEKTYPTHKKLRFDSGDIPIDGVNANNFWSVDQDVSPRTAQDQASINSSNGVSVDSQFEFQEQIHTECK